MWGFKKNRKKKSLRLEAKVGGGLPKKIEIPAEENRRAIEIGDVVEIRGDYFNAGWQFVVEEIGVKDGVGWLKIRSLDDGMYVKVIPAMQADYAGRKERVVGG